MKQIIRLMKARGALLMRAIKVAENDAKWWISFFAPKALIYYAYQRNYLTLWLAYANITAA